MKIIIFGAGELGYIIASEFYTENDITVIDDEQNKIDAFNKLDVSFVSGNASSLDVLKQAGIKDADVFIACTNSDELNIVGCFTAKRVGNRGECRGLSMSSGQGGHKKHGSPGGGSPDPALPCPGFLSGEREPSLYHQPY